MTKKQAKVIENSPSLTAVDSLEPEVHPIVQPPTLQSAEQAETQATQMVEPAIPPSDPEPKLTAPEPEHRVTEALPTSTRDFPIDINIRIRPVENTYEMEILPSRRSPINCGNVDISQNELENSIRELQEWLNTSSVGISVEKESSPPYELVREGHRLFKKIFKKTTCRKYIKDLLSANQGSSRIQIASEDFFWPWEFIYPDDSFLDEPGYYDRFWGMKHIIHHAIITKEPTPGAYVSPNIPADPPPKLGLLTDDSFKGVREKEILFFKDDLDRNGRIRLFRLRALDYKKWREEIKVFTAFWEESFDLAHFACHAYHDDEHKRPGIQLSDQFRVMLDDIEVSKLKLDGNPLIVMNACETGATNPLYTSHFVKLFIERGARGVVATEHFVKDDFAADFAKKLYTYLFEGKKLGESLLSARRYFWKEYNNPSGLLYSMYAPPSIRIS